MCFLYKMTITLKTKEETEKISAFVLKIHGRIQKNFLGKRQ